MKIRYIKLLSIFLVLSGMIAISSSTSWAEDDEVASDVNAVDQWRFVIVDGVSPISLDPVMRCVTLKNEKLAPVGMTRCQAYIGEDVFREDSGGWGAPRRRLQLLVTSDDSLAEPSRIASGFRGVDVPKAADNWRKYWESDTSEDIRTNYGTLFDQTSDAGSVEDSYYRIALEELIPNVQTTLEFLFDPESETNGDTPREKATALFAGVRSVLGGVADYDRFISSRESRTDKELRNHLEKFNDGAIAIGTLDSTETGLKQLSNLTDQFREKYPGGDGEWGEESLDAVADNDVIYFFDEKEPREFTKFLTFKTDIFKKWVQPWKLATAVLAGLALLLLCLAIWRHWRSRVFSKELEDLKEKEKNNKYKGHSREYGGADTNQSYLNIVAARERLYGLTNTIRLQSAGTSPSPAANALDEIVKVLSGQNVDDQKYQGIQDIFLGLDVAQKHREAITRVFEPQFGAASHFSASDNLNGRNFLDEILRYNKDCLQVLPRETNFYALREKLSRMTVNVNSNENSDTIDYSGSESEAQPVSIIDFINELEVQLLQEQNRMKYVTADIEEVYSLTKGDSTFDATEASQQGTGSEIDEGNQKDPGRMLSRIRNLMTSMFSAKNNVSDLLKQKEQDAEALRKLLEILSAMARISYFDEKPFVTAQSEIPNEFSLDNPTRIFGRTLQKYLDHHEELLSRFTQDLDLQHAHACVRFLEWSHDKIKERADEYSSKDEGGLSETEKTFVNIYKELNLLKVVIPDIDKLSIAWRRVNSVRDDNRIPTADQLRACLRDQVDTSFESWGHLLMRSHSILQTYFKENEELRELSKELELAAGAYAYLCHLSGYSVSVPHILDHTTSPTTPSYLNERKQTGVSTVLSRFDEVRSLVLQSLEYGGASASDETLIVDLVTMEIQDISGEQTPIMAKVTVARPQEWV